MRLYGYERVKNYLTCEAYMYRIVTGIALISVLVAASVTAAGAQRGYGRGNLPQGSYQSSCINASMNGSTLSASCTPPSGARIYSSLDVNTCNGADIGNRNGYLACLGNPSYGNGNGNGYGNGRYRGRGNRVPSGSYQQSCTNASVSGGQLTASCVNNRGSRRTSSLNLSQCRQGSDIGNVNGRLRCQ
jgi:hypothetical protein